MTLSRGRLTSFCRGAAKLFPPKSDIMLLSHYYSLVLILVLSALLLGTNNNVDGFIMSRLWMPYISYSHRGISTIVSTPDTTSYPSTVTYLESQPKKRRRRKLSDQDESKAPSSNVVEGGISPTKEDVASGKSDDKLEDKDIDKEEEEENYYGREQGKKEEATKVGEDKLPVFKFNREEALAFGIEDATDAEDIPEQFKLAPTKDKNKGGALELPSMKDAMSRKRIAQQQGISTGAKDEPLVEDTQKKIKRSNIQTFNKLLEVEPNADTDLSFFEEEKYGTVSALLGEGAKSFLGLPFAILQTGHFIGTLAIMLMAFVEYPGFPLTNLPTPIRESLQGGLFTIYTINAVLAVIATFKAAERGQPKALWAMKTLGVGGLAFDQLTQLPTKEQMAKLKNQGKKTTSRGKKM